MKSTSLNGDGEERAAGGVLFHDEAGRRLFLLLRHERGGHWGFPKGRVEAGESELDAALREIREETGISNIELVDGVAVTSRYPILRDGRSLSKTVTYFAARVRGEPVCLSHEHTDARWATTAEAARILTHAESRRVLHAVESALASVRMA
jgi:8-oxo-dGTP pyrophosphatase MutT (NUDIX family)